MQCGLPPVPAVFNETHDPGPEKHEPDSGDDRQEDREVFARLMSEAESNRKDH